MRKIFVVLSILALMAAPVFSISATEQLDKATMKTAGAESVHFVFVVPKEDVEDLDTEKDAADKQDTEQIASTQQTVTTPAAEQSAQATPVPVSQNTQPASTPAPQPQENTQPAQNNTPVAPTQPSAPAHEHTWVHHDAVYETVHHDAIYNTVHHDAVYNTVHHEGAAHYAYVCNQCGYSTQDGAEIGWHLVDADHDNFRTDTWNDPGYDEQVLVSEAYDEQVLVSDAYDEQVLVSAAYDECSGCGARK